MAISFSTIEDAFLYVSFGTQYENDAVICRETGEVYYASEMGDSDELPDDVDDERKYIYIPHKNDLDLGKELVFEFVAERLPDELDRVCSFFGRSGAYARFKDLLEYRGKLDEWYEFENARQTAALREWCANNNIELVD
jgi:hypothetical protein